jgi:MoxR-like ATPase
MNSKSLFTALKNALSSQIIGQEHLVDRLLIALLADGHLLVEGAPGLAKTRAIKALSENIDADFHRIQFTPDLLPSDITGTEVFRPEDSSFQFQQGPIFHNLVLADEINRAPAKVQSALLEAMAERQVSVGRVTYPLPPLFLVMATQNPIEQEGTYPLPEAQLDRFLMHVTIDYPDIEAERKILQLVRAEASGSKDTPIAEPVNLSQEQILEARQTVLAIHMAEPIEEYIIQLIMATRQPEAYHESLANWIEYGASPRATISLDRCARAHAWLQGKDFVSPDDVQAVLHDVIRHRIILSFEAEASGRTKDDIINILLDCVPAP